MFRPAILDAQADHRVPGHAFAVQVTGDLVEDAFQIGVTELGGRLRQARGQDSQQVIDGDAVQAGYRLVTQGGEKLLNYRDEFLWGWHS